MSALQSQINNLIAAAKLATTRKEATSLYMKATRLHTDTTNQLYLDHAMHSPATIDHTHHDIWEGVAGLCDWKH